MRADDAHEVIEWFAAEARDLPWRRPGFSAWGTLVSEVMLQQTQVARVVPRLAAWLGRWPTPADLAAAPTADVLRMWDRLGYPRRAVNLQRTAAVIAAEHGNVVPANVGALLALPGIGDYTARAVAVFAYRMREPVVDTNVRRVLARAVHGEADARIPSRRDLAGMRELLPEDAAESAAFTAGMMELGALVCVARAPGCDRCPIADACAWRQAGYPARVGPPPRRQERFEGSDRQARGAVLAVLRSASGPVPVGEVVRGVGDSNRAQRILGGLVADGLAEERDGLVALPGGFEERVA